MEILILIFLVATLVIRFLIGARLFVSSRQNNLPNLQWLALYFFVNAFNILFAPHPYNPLGNQSFSLAMFVLPVLVTQILLILFNRDTFYKDKQSPAIWFWVIFAITSIGTIYGVAISPSSSEQSPWVATYVISQLLIWLWHAQVAYQAWSGIARERTVEDWVKSRYLLIAAYPLVFVIGSLASAIRIVFTGGAGTDTLGITAAAVTLFAQFISVVMQYLAWVLPETFRLWLNRDYHTRLKEHSEHQSRAILQMIGASISRDAKVNQISSLMAVRHVIGKMINAESAEVIEKHISKMGYQEWLSVLQNPELAKHLALVSAAKNMDVIVENATRTLVEKQSLFTIESK
jgi:hypothetical protein